MKIDKKWLQEKDACSEGIKWFLEQKETNGLKLVKKLATKNHWNWANWLVVRLMTYKQDVSYAVFAAEQVIDIYEKCHPEDKRARNAIEAAKKCIADPSKEKKAAAAYAAAYAAAADAYDTAAYAADAYDVGAYAAADAAYAAAAAADAAAAYAAYAAADAAHAAAAAYAAAVVAAAYAAAAAAYAAAYAMRKKIIEYGISLLTKQGRPL